MLFMVIERFANDDMLPVYERVRDQGRGRDLGAGQPVRATLSPLPPSFGVRAYALDARGFGRREVVIPSVRGRFPGDAGA